MIIWFFLLSEPRPLTILLLLNPLKADYVSCKTCKSADTILTKENRLFFVQCESCGSSRSVSAIKTGFVAQTQKRSGMYFVSYVSHLAFTILAKNSPESCCWLIAFHSNGRDSMQPFSAPTPLASPPEPWESCDLGAYCYELQEPTFPLYFLYSLYMIMFTPSYNAIITYITVSEVCGLRLSSVGGWSQSSCLKG